MMLQATMFCDLIIIIKIFNAVNSIPAKTLANANFDF